MKKNGPLNLTFYGVSKLRVEDIDLIATLKSLRSLGRKRAYLRYETLRTIYHRLGTLELSDLGVRLPNPVPPEAKALWQKLLSRYAKPWVRLSPSEKISLTQETPTEHALPWRLMDGRSEAKQKVPTDKLPNFDGTWGDRITFDLPGNTFLMRIDLDLTDAEIVKRFRVSLKGIRGRNKYEFDHSPTRKKEDSIEDTIRSIVAIRARDCSGGSSGTARERLLQYFYHDAGVREGSLDNVIPSGKRLPEGADRFRKWEKDFQVKPPKFEIEMRSS